MLLALSVEGTVDLLLAAGVAIVLLVSLIVCLRKSDP